MKKARAKDVRSDAISYLIRNRHVLNDQLSFNAKTDKKFGEALVPGQETPGNDFDMSIDFQRSSMNTRNQPSKANKSMMLPSKQQQFLAASRNVGHSNEQTFKVQKKLRTVNVSPASTMN